MLVQFTVGNYRSIRERVTLSMVAAPLKAADPMIDQVNTLETPGGKLLGSAVIYGANASGKSNILRAMAVMKRLVVDSARAGQIGDRLPMEPFLLSEASRSEPSFFEIVFRAEDGEGGERQYRYGFEATAEAVVSEWLFQKKQRESLVFERKVGGRSYFSDWLPVWKKLLPLVRSNTLFLSVAAQFNQPVASHVLQWLNGLNIFTSQTIPDPGESTRAFVRNAINLARVSSLLRSLDTSITEIVPEYSSAYSTAESLGRKFRNSSYEEFSESVGRHLENVGALLHLDDEKRRVSLDILPRIKTRHVIFDTNGSSIMDIEFDLENQESHGTNRLFALAGPILSTLDNSSVLVIDEIEAQLHPHITREIFRMFSFGRPEKSKAQLIAATHDTNLLDPRLLRRDQVWFVQKDDHEASELYSLAEIKVRAEASFERDYLLGRYGGAPQVPPAELLRAGGLW